jgi:hypothetical protein
MGGADATYHKVGCKDRPWLGASVRQAAPVQPRTWWIIGGALALGASGLIGGLRGYVGPLMTPFQRAVAGEGLTPAEEEVAVLREQVAHLGSENIVLRTRLADYAGIIGEGQVPPDRVVVARGRIISRSSRAGRRYLELDVGRIDGVAKGMPVGAGWGLVGLVAGTDDGRCLVQVMTDSEFRVAAAVLSQPTKDAPARILCEGVIAGQGRRDELTLEFADPAPGLELVPDLPVVTAGADGRLPTGMSLGTIREATRLGGNRWQVRVAPTRDPEQHESLLILRFYGR